MIKLITFGKIKEDYLKEAIDDYLKRINKYHKIEIIELKDDENILVEEKELIKLFDNKSYYVLFDMNGKNYSSLDLANLIDKNFTYYPNLVFIIGSSNGVSDIIKKKVNEAISFGKITMPHGLFRVVALEQIYRAFKINNNESYHK